MCMSESHGETSPIPRVEIDEVFKLAWRQREKKLGIDFQLLDVRAQDVTVKVIGNLIGMNVPTDNFHYAYLVNGVALKPKNVMAGLLGSEIIQQNDLVGPEMEGQEKAIMWTYRETVKEEEVTKQFKMKLETARSLMKLAAAKMAWSEDETKATLNDFAVKARDYFPVGQVGQGPAAPLLSAELAK